MKKRYPVGKGTVPIGISEAIANFAPIPGATALKYFKEEEGVYVTSTELFIHPKLPGVLMKKVGSWKDVADVNGGVMLFRGNRLVFMAGMHMENFLEHGVIPAANMPGAWDTAHASFSWPTGTIKEARWDFVRKNLPAGALSQAELDRLPPLFAPSGSDAATPSANTLAPAPFADVYRSRFATRGLGMVSTGEVYPDIYVDVSAVETELFHVMAIVTEADAGFGVIITGGAQANSNLASGWLGKTVHGPLLRDVYAKQAAQIIADAPGDARKFYERAVDIEIRLLGEERLEVPFGVSVSSRFRATLNHWDLGILVPYSPLMSYNTADGPSVASFAHDKWCAGRYLAQRVEGASWKDIQDELSSRLLCGYAIGDNGRDLVTKEWQWPATTPGTTMEAWLLAQAKLLEGGPSEEDVQAAADAAGTTVLSTDGLSVVLGSTDTTNLLGSVGHALISRDEVAYLAAKRAREFFCAVHRRAEKMVQ